MYTTECFNKLIFVVILYSLNFTLNSFFQDIFIYFNNNSLFYYALRCFSKLSKEPLIKFRYIWTKVQFLLKNYYYYYTKNELINLRCFLKPITNKQMNNPSITSPEGSSKSLGIVFYSLIMIL